MIAETLTQDECLILNMYYRKNRKEVIGEIESLLPDIKEDDEVMYEIVKILLKKLNNMTDEFFNNLDL